MPDHHPVKDEDAQNMFTKNEENPCRLVSMFPPLYLFNITDGPLLPAPPPPTHASRGLRLCLILEILYLSFKRTGVWKSILRCGNQPHFGLFALQLPPTGSQTWNDGGNIYDKFGSILRLLVLFKPWFSFVTVLSLVLAFRTNDDVEAHVFTLKRARKQMLYIHLSSLHIPLISWQNRRHKSR